MLQQGLIRIGVILAASTPSMLCFGLSTYLLAHQIQHGWGWLMLIGFLGLEIPREMLHIPGPNESAQSSIQQEKPEPIYEDCV
jgi:hypothetical protein